MFFYFEGLERSKAFLYAYKNRTYKISRRDFFRCQIVDNIIIIIFDKKKKTTRILIIILRAIFP